MDDDIDLFFETGPRSENDSRTKRRELLLARLHTTPTESLTRPRLQHLYMAWMNLLQSLCSSPYETLRVVRKGGRGTSHDLLVSYFVGSTPAMSHILEYKHNVNRLSALPEYLSVASNKPYLPRLYADFFYDRVGELCALYPGLPAPPDRQTYLRLVHGNNYNRHPFFRALKDREHEHAEEKRQIVRASIRDYLHTYKDALNLAELEADIRKRQTGKVFVMWDLTTFHTDTLADDEMALVGPVVVENDNRLVVQSRAGTRHKLLLRWKNHAGILYPAWQISLAR
jgi:hypothetical protein